MTGMPWCIFTDGFPYHQYKLIYLNCYLEWVPGFFI